MGGGYNTRDVIQITGDGKKSGLTDSHSRSVVAGC